MHGFCWKRSTALEHRLGWAGTPLAAPYPSPPTEPSNVGLLFPQTSPRTFPSSLQHSLVPQIKPGGPVQLVTEAPQGYRIPLRSAWLSLGRDACEMPPHHPKGTAREQLSHQQQGGPCSAASTCAADDLGRRAEEVHAWAVLVSAGTE